MLFRSVPLERIEAMRRAFLQALADPELLAEGARQMLVVNPLSGAALEKMIHDLYATPPDIISKLNAEVIKAAQTPDARQRLAGAGADPATGTPQQLAQMIRTETAKWAKVVKDAKIVQE